MLPNIRKLSIKLSIDHDVWFLEEPLSSASFLLGQIPHAALDTVLHPQVRIDDPHVVSAIRIVISPMERARKREVVFRKHAPGNSRHEHSPHERV